MAKYVIKSECDGVVDVVDESTTKHEIESKFNRLMGLIRSDAKFSVENIRDGYSKVIFWGTFGQVETEYWIARV